MAKWKSNCLKWRLVRDTNLQDCKNLIDNLISKGYGTVPSETLSEGNVWYPSFKQTKNNQSEFLTVVLNSMEINQQRI